MRVCYPSVGRLVAGECAVPQAVGFGLKKGVHDAQVVHEVSM